jgi:hypothetical protein
MYFPYLRGRQFELIALRELLEQKALSEKVIPIIEPVKLTSTLVKTINAYGEKTRPLSLIGNPLVGSFNSDFNDEKNVVLRDAFLAAIEASNSLIYAHILKSETAIEYFISKHEDEMMTISLDKDAAELYEKYFQGLDSKYNLMPDESGIRRKIRTNRVMLDDKFKKLQRNTDYEGIDEPFSEDHLFYKDDGYKGFSDFSVVGDEYSETGFAPYAVAIHIVYFDKDDSLRIVHFVSDSNDDITDPAGKFKEALEKLVIWNKEKCLDTIGIKAFEDLYEREAYPGLGTVKKLGIMHHLELISRYLDRE